MKNFLLAAILAACLPPLGCKDSAKNYPVQFVDRNAAFSLDNKLNPLRLVVEINENGKLRLNKIETGTIEDATFLSERLKTIFADREKAAIGEREIVIDPQYEVEEENLERLIESLAGANAAPILIIKSDL
ncbi:MAG: hypothetical protein LC778_02295 [Acidobacteria bacterium]|nr:hypothetical protein [Acidobacteriota bacterium]